MEELYQLGYELSQDHKNIRDKMLYLSRKREKYRLMDDKKNYDLVTKKILDTHDQDVFFKIEADVLLIYTRCLAFYLAFISSQEDVMIDMKKKIEDNVELIRNKALSNKFDFFQHDNIKYQEEILKSLAQIENIMYFPVCKVNEYKYFPHISKIEKIINEQKTKFIEVKDDKQKKNCQK